MLADIPDNLLRQLVGSDDSVPAAGPLQELLWDLSLPPLPAPVRPPAAPLSPPHRDGLQSGLVPAGCPLPTRAAGGQSTDRDGCGSRPPDPPAGDLLPTPGGLI